MDWKSKRMRALLETALVEDKAAYDVTTALTVDPRLRATGTIVAKQPCVVAGLGCIPVFLEIFQALSAQALSAQALSAQALSAKGAAGRGEQAGGLAGGLASGLGRFEVISHPEVFDGVRVKKGQTVAVIRSTASTLLSTERVILNLLQRMSGIATLTKEFVDAVKGTGTKILDTRKTIPGLRQLDKYAVVCGGGVNHRLDLEDGVLIKNNHIALGGGVTEALAHALSRRKPDQRVQIEVRSEQELEAALAGRPDSLLLDNMTPAGVKRAVQRIRKALPGAPIEASGNMSLKTVRAYALAGADLVSVGALTHSAVAVDLSMKIVADVS